MPHRVTHCYSPSTDERFRKHLAGERALLTFGGCKVGHILRDGGLSTERFVAAPGHPWS